MKALFVVSAGALSITGNLPANEIKDKQDTEIENTKL